MTYVDGVSYIHKANVRRHVQSGSLHDWAKRKFSGTASETVSLSTSSNASTSTQNETQNTIPHSFAKINKLHYRNHFNTALTIVMKESPMTEYKDLIELQKKNGVQFMVDGKDSDKRCRDFISYLASAMRDDIKNILNCANLFSIEQDGTEPKKTKEEKELVYIKIVVRGRPIELFLKCQRMNDFGRAEASCLKKKYR